RRVRYAAGGGGGGFNGLGGGGFGGLGRWRTRCLMRSKEAFASSRSTGYFCSVATDHPAPFRRVTPRRAGACHDATGMERHDKDGLLGWWRSPSFTGQIRQSMAHKDGRAGKP